MKIIAPVSRKDNALIVDVYRKPTHTDRYLDFWVSLGVRTCELFLCFVSIVRVRAIVLTSLFSLFYVTCEFHRFLHRRRASLIMTNDTRSARPRLYYIVQLIFRTRNKKKRLNLFVSRRSTIQLLPPKCYF